MSVREQIVKFNRAYPSFKLREFKEPLTLLEVEGEYGELHAFHTRWAKTWDIAVPEFDPHDGVFANVSWERAESLVMGFIPDSTDFLKRVLPQTSEYFLTVSNIMRSQSDIDILLNVYRLGWDILHAAGLSSSDFKQTCQAYSLVSGILAVPSNSRPCDIDRGVSSFAVTNGCIFKSDGSPWFVQETRNMSNEEQLLFVGDRQLRLSDLGSANLDSLHQLNGHPGTAISLIICQVGFKLRLRIPCGEEGVYNCYQFPGGDFCQKFDEAGKSMFLKLMCHIVFGSLVIQGQPVIEPLWWSESEEGPTLLAFPSGYQNNTDIKFVCRLRNEESTRETSIAYYRLEGLPPGLYEKLVSESERLALEELER